MSRKIFRSHALLSLVVILCSLLCILGSLYGYYDGILLSHLRSELEIAATGTELAGLEFLQQSYSSGHRLTWIDPQGRVLYDSTTNADSLSSHLDRQEIRQALETGTGSAIRYSDTQTEQTLYEAMRLKDGSVLRISMKKDSAFGMLLDLLPIILLVLLVTIGLSLLLSRNMTRRIVEPINRIDPKDPLAIEGDPEITPLLRRLDQQNKQIDKQLSELHDRAEEFRLISESMHEGLFLLDAQGEIRSINPAACRIFCPREDYRGKLLIDLEPTGELNRSLEKALEQGHMTVRMNHEGRSYRFEFSRISSEEKAVGAVLLVIDITDTVNAQKTRREFSANVSHELKTPLQTIMGSAELLENNMVRPEDQGRFYSHIRKESQRLLDLIQDIIRLSQLDEGAPMPVEQVDVAELCRQVYGDLEKKAGRKMLSFDIHTVPCSLKGVRRLLEELVYNLCDNAIKYTPEQGQVELGLKDLGPELELVVKDTGIGIPPEHQGRIFERFYRVDKSHSRASGGTGLGLSIAKHATEYHGGKIRLESTLGHGTQITVSLPKNYSA